MADVDLPSAYRYAAVHCGVRPDTDRFDLALVVSDRPAAAAGVFTQNRVVAAPVRVCRDRLPAGDVRGLVVCAGNANACTGAQGLADARRMTALAAEGIGARESQLLVCSTGVIGRPLPMPQIEAGIAEAATRLGENADSFDRATRAILTTDTRPKVSCRTVAEGGAAFRVAGFAKGAAMIGPNMATMLGFVLSDAVVQQDHLAALAGLVADRTFNCITVEGHTSTNDSLIFLANGAGPGLTGPALARFDSAVEEVCADLARMIAADAEGASHLIRIDVQGLATEQDARRIAKTIADSALVKTAIFGADPNWGRIVSAAGYAGVAFEESDLSLWLGDLALYQFGTPLPFDARAASDYLRNNREIGLRLRFTLGDAGCTFWTCDLTDEYVRLNADYTT